MAGRDRERRKKKRKDSCIQRQNKKNNAQERFFLAPTTKERAFSGTSPLPITQEGNSPHIIKGAIERWLKHQKRGLPELMIEARKLSGQVPLIDHNDIVEMLHGPIYIKTETESPWY